MQVLSPKMKAKRIIKGVIFAWGIPLVIIITPWLSFPDLNRPKDSFPSQVFTPSRVMTKEKQDLRGSDHFELWLHHPEGPRFFHRNPEPEPIIELYRRIPQDAPLKVVYRPTVEGNVLMEISIADAEAKPILSITEAMAEYSSRRRLIYVVAGIIAPRASSNGCDWLGDRRDGRLWECTYPQGEMHGAGPPQLSVISPEMAAAKYPVSITTA
jgi:immunity protein 27 of polymorphic toxin system